MSSKIIQKSKSKSKSKTNTHKKTKQRGGSSCSAPRKPMEGGDPGRVALPPQYFGGNSNGYVESSSAGCSKQRAVSQGIIHADNRFAGPNLYPMRGGDCGCNGRKLKTMKNRKQKGGFFGSRSQNHDQDNRMSTHSKSSMATATTLPIIARPPPANPQVQMGGFFGASGNRSYSVRTPTSPRVTRPRHIYKPRITYAMRPNRY
jgi:hypothetical protein